MSRKKNSQQQQHEQDEDKTRNECGLSFREAEIDVGEDEDKKPVVRMSVSSETPVLTYVRMGDQWMMAYEILDHNESSIDRSRCSDGLVIQDTHYGDQIGLIRAPIISNKKLGGIVEFCAGERAKEIGLDAANGLRRNTSVGYRCDPDKYVMEGQKDGYPVVRSLSWCPHEASFVNVPADTSVGVGRALNVNEKQTPHTEGEGRQEMTPKEMADLFTRGAKFGVSAEEVQKLIDADQGRAELDAMIVERQASKITELSVPKKEDPTQGQRKTPPIIGGDRHEEEKIARNYSILNVLRRAAGIKTFGFGQKVDCGFEDEINQECRRLGLGSVRGGEFILPHAVLANRSFTVAGTSSATVATNLLTGEFIDALRPKTILEALGVDFRTGWVGNIDISKMTAGATGYWVPEGGDITDSGATLGTVQGTPHTCGFSVDITRRMLLQSTPAAEMLTRDDILKGMAIMVQTAYFTGTGADGQPSGIISADGVNLPSVTQGTPTYAELLGFPGDIMADEAESDNQKWVISAAVWKKLAATFTDGTAKAERVLDYTAKTLLGYPYIRSQSVGAKAAMFGDFTQTMVGIWGAGVDLNVDTASLSKSGGLRLVALQDVDILARHGEALAYCAAVTA